MVVYRFKVALDHDKRTYRNIEILENQSLEDFHDIIFKAFERYDEHLYSFYITIKKTTSIQSRYKSPEYTCGEYFDDNFNSMFGAQKYDALETQVGSLGLRVKDKIYYLFDFGDSWWHEVTLLSIDQTNNKKGYPKIVKIAGKSPPQYPDYDNDDY